MLNAPGSGMPDPVILTSMTDEAVGIAAANNTSGASRAWDYGVAFIAFFPVVLANPHTYTTAWWLNGATAAGNVDVGIYTISGTTATKVVASTAAAQSGTSALQTAGTFAGATIGPGLYYLAIGSSLATATYMSTAVTSYSQFKVMGAFISSTAAHPMSGASTVTVAANTAGIVIPVFGFSESSTV